MRQNGTVDLSHKKQGQAMKNIAVFASGNGTNLQAIIDNTASGVLRGAHLALVVSDKRSAFALRRAKKPA